MAGTLRRRLRADISRGDAIFALNRYLFEELAFSGNESNFFDPRNSYLNEVMDRRLGIPISLSVIYLEVGQRIGLPLRGASFPGHFLVKCSLHTGIVVLDPYAKGASLSAAALDERLRIASGHSSPDPGALQRALRTASMTEIVARMLRNLQAVYLQRENRDKALWAADRIISLMPDAAEPYRERGRIYLEMDCFRGALADFRTYLELKPAAPDADAVRARIEELQAVAQRLN
jgi:regulator of sirC expression with transglutaminase-like and TPR domain